MRDESEDKKIWAFYARQVTRKPKRAAPFLASSPTAKRATRSVSAPQAGEDLRAALSAATSAPPSYVTPPFALAAAPFDRKTEKQWREGSVSIEARIDLHGMTQTQAYAALARFLAVQHKAGKRRLLIITGKGRGGAGTLRTQLPDWLASLDEARFILALRPAAPKHGGDGAFYVLLKKQKNSSIYNI